MQEEARHNLFFRPSTAGLWRSSELLSPQRGILFTSKQKENDLGASRDPYRWVFWGLYGFTLVLFGRPQEFVPGLALIPFAKIFALLTPLAFIWAQIKARKSGIRWTMESTLILAILGLAIFHMPFAKFPGATYDTLKEPFIKIVIMSIILIGGLQTRERLLALLRLQTWIGAIMGGLAINNYLKGALIQGGQRIRGTDAGIFANPNDLATFLCITLPFAVLFALQTTGKKRWLYGMFAGVMAGGVVATFSRGGFLSLVVGVLFMAWKFGYGHRVRVCVATVFLAATFMVAMPPGYTDRLYTIYDNSQDQTGSAQERRNVMQLALETAIQNPIIGLGMGNFERISPKRLMVHNAYLHITVELGVAGLILFLLLQLHPFRHLARIRRELLPSVLAEDQAMKHLCVSLQVALLCCAVSSLFSPLQYFWFIYYLCGYAAALRQIYIAENRDSIGKPRRMGILLRAKPQGFLWRPQLAFTDKSEKTPLNRLLH